MVARLAQLDAAAAIAAIITKVIVAIAAVFVAHVWVVVVVVVIVVVIVAVVAIASIVAVAVGTWRVGTELTAATSGVRTVLLFDGDDGAAIRVAVGEQVRQTAVRSVRTQWCTAAAAAGASTSRRLFAGTTTGAVAGHTIAGGRAAQATTGSIDKAVHQTAIGTAARGYIKGMEEIKKERRN